MAMHANQKCTLVGVSSQGTRPWATNAPKKDVIKSIDFEGKTERNLNNVYSLFPIPAPNSTNLGESLSPGTFQTRHDRLADLLREAIAANECLQK